MKMSKRHQERAEQEHGCRDQRRRLAQDEIYRSAQRDAHRLWHVR
jgi:hypothetical protein